MKNKFKIIYTALFAMQMSCISYQVNAQSCADGNYQFSDVVAIFAASGCNGCHGSQGGLDLTNYNNVINGGNNGVGGCGSYATALDYLIGKVDGSLTAGDACGGAMPNGTPYGTAGMAAADIAAVQTWIDAGASQFCPPPPCTDIVVSAHPVCNGTAGTFDIQINSITGGDGSGDPTGTYTVSDGTNTISYPTTTSITALAYTNQNDKITLTITDNDDTGCSVSYDVLQLECLDQTVCECGVDNPFNINAQASANGDGYSMVYVVTDNGGVVLAVNQTGSFGPFPDDGVLYNVVGYNVADADLAGLEADLNTLIGSSVAPSLTASQAAPFDAYCYVDMTASFTEDCEILFGELTNQAICTENATGFDLTSLESAGETGGVWTIESGGIVSSVDIADGDIFYYMYNGINDCPLIDTLIFTLNQGSILVLDFLTVCPEDAIGYDLTQLQPPGTSGSWGVADPTNVDVATGLYTYTYTDENGCISSVEANIIVLDAITFVLEDAEVCPGGSVVFEPTGLDPAGNFTYAWSTGETTSTIIASLVGDYSLTVTDANGCIGSNFTFLSELTECDATCVTIQSCDDSNPCTTNDMETIGTDGSTCIPCAGTVDPSSCDAACTTTQTCDDNDPLTINDMEVVAADGSICTACAGVPATACSDTTVESCDDGDPCTIDDEQTVSNLDATVCIPCAGTAIPAVEPVFTGLTTAYCEGATTDALPTVDDSGITGTWFPTAIDNTTSGTYMFTPGFMECANEFVVDVTITPECDATCSTTQACDDGDACTENDMETVGSGGGVCVPCAGTPVSTIFLNDLATVCRDDALNYDLSQFEPTGSIGTWDGVADPTSADVSAGDIFTYNFTNESGCDGVLSLFVSVLSEIQIVAAPTCDNAAEGTFFIDIQSVTGGLFSPGTYTVSAGGLSIEISDEPVAGSGTIGPFTYTDHNTAITLNVTSNVGCTATYDVLQLNCADQEVCDCTDPEMMPYTINAQAAANANGYSMVYALVNTDNVNSVELVNDTGIFADLPDNTNYIVYAFNVEDVDVTSFTADLNAVTMISAGDEILTNMGAFANYCYDSASAAFIEDCACMGCDDFVINSSSTDLTCNGDASGAIDLTVSNGQTPYTYTWSNGATTQDLAGLDGGAYTVTVNDAGECMDVVTIIIGEPAAIGLSVAGITEPTCNQSNGSVFLAVANGVAPFTYGITELGISQSSSTIGGLPAGTYTATVTDANNCTAFTPITLSDSDTPNATITIDNSPDCDQNDGTVTASASGGTPPYDYAWDDAAAQTTATASNLAAGVYTVIITDAAGCSATESVTLTPVGCEFSITNTFFANDGCKCNNDQTANAAGDGTFEETVTVIAPAGLIIRADVTSTGIEDPVNQGLSTSVLPIEFYESFPGRYILIFNHIDRVGYTINVEYSTDGGLTFMPAPNGFGGQLSYTNVCAYPVLAFNPPLEAAYCEDDGIVVIGVIETSDNVDFVALPGFPSVQLNNDDQQPSPVTFDPTTFGTATYTFSGFYNYENGTGTGGTADNPAVSLNPCATLIRVNVPVNPVPESEATCQQTGAEEFIIDVDPNDDYETPENLMYRIGNSGPFQTSDQFVVEEDGDYEMTIVDAVSACLYQVETVCFRQLPIELVSFEGNCVDDEYTLVWTTATEEDVSHFAVERSIDGQNYIQIGEVDAVGNSTVLQTYGYKDASGISREYYYRLRIVEFSGTETISRIETVSCLTGGFGVLDVYPNPTEDEVAVSFEVASRDVLNLKLVDVLGRSVSEQQITPDIGLNRAVIDMSALPSAMYYIILEDGRQQSVEKVVKK